MLSFLPCCQCFQSSTCIALPPDCVIFEFMQEAESAITDMTGKRNFRPVLGLPSMTLANLIHVGFAEFGICMNVLLSTEFCRQGVQPYVTLWYNISECSTFPFLVSTYVLKFWIILAGKWLGTRPIRCNWATKTNSSAQADETNNGGGHGVGMNGAVDPLAGLQSLGQGVPHFPLNLTCLQLPLISFLCLICSEIGYSAFSHLVLILQKFVQKIAKKALLGMDQRTILSTLPSMSAIWLMRYLVDCAYPCSLLAVLFQSSWDCIGGSC